MTIFEKHFSSILAGMAGAILTVAAIVGVLFTHPTWTQKLLALSPQVSSSVEETTEVSKDSQKIAVKPGLEDVVAKANGAVVSIVVSKDVPIVTQQNLDPFRDFFGGNSPFRIQIPQQQPPQNGTEKQEVGGGSGFLISSDGYIVTNNHVVDDVTAEYAVFTNDGKEYPAKIIAKDDVLDIALLKIDGKDLAFLSFADSETARLGQTVIAIGNALAEFRNTVSVGVISGLSRSITAGDGAGKSEQIDNVIQTDAAINPGNSGGPLLNMAGEVIGVNVAVARGGQSIGFALPANSVAPAVASMKLNGRVIRPYLGVRYVQVTASLKEKNNLPVDHGALVLRGEAADLLAVMPGSPADKAGIVENDIVLEVDSTAVDETHTLGALIRLKKVGDRVTLKVFHRGEEKSIGVTLEEMPQKK